MLIKNTLSFLLLSLSLSTTTTVLSQSNDCDTVLAIYKAMGGSTTLKDGCKLDGVVEKYYEGARIVKKIDWNKRNLRGRIPKEIGKLSNLYSLKIAINQLYGTIPPEIGNLTNLEFLTLDYNNLSGSIPTEIGKLSKLRYLYLGFNNINGAIPSQVGNLENLIQLNLQQSQLSGPIPPTIGNLSKLEYLRLNHNQLSGPIPKEIGKLSNIQALYLNDNQLTSVPSLLALKDTLEKFAILPNPIADIPQKIFNLNPAAVLSPANWTNLLSINVQTKVKRQQSSSMTAQELYQLCPLNEIRKREVVAGCVSGIYNRFCKDKSDLKDCQDKYDAVVSQSYFAPLGVCAAWRSGPNSPNCRDAITSFVVKLDYITLTRSHANDFVSSIYNNRVYAPCNGDKCKWS